MKDFAKEDFISDIYEDTFIVTINFARATLHESKELNSIIELALLRHYNKIIIELEEIDFIDSTFLGVLVVTKKKLLNKKGDLILVGLKPDVHAILERTKLLRLFTVFETKEEALNHFQVRV